MADEDAGQVHFASEHGTVATHPGRTINPFLVAPTVANEFNTLALDLVPVACMTLSDILFEFDSSFVTPQAALILKELPGLREKNKNKKGQLPPLSVFGHADPVGADEYNKQLSGRRAMAIYGLLTHDLSLWNFLSDNPLGGDNWHAKKVEETMRSTTGSSGKKGKDLFQDYMAALFPTPLEKSDFLGQGVGPKGKADFQGCSDFNPLVVLSKSENKSLSEKERNEANQADRRVVVFLFRPGSKANPALWPCPTALEPTAACRLRFFVSPPKGDERRQSGALRREHEKLHDTTEDTFACRFYDRIAHLSPCEVPPPPLAPATVKLLKIETSVFAPPPLIPVFFDDDDFSPRLKEHAKVHVRIEHLPPGAAVLRIDFGRLTNRPNNPATADVNESFTLVARVDVNITGGTDPLDTEVEWDGQSTVAAPQEFSDRQTTNTVSGAKVNIPLPAIPSGQPVPHGLYVIDQITVLKGGKEIAKDQPANADLSVPILINLIFNAKWPGDLSAFGLAPFRSQLEDALQRFGGRDYMIRDPTLANRINARFISDASITNAQSVVVSIGGASGGTFGSTPDGPAPLSDNLYVFNEGISADITVFPTTFMVFNTAAGAIGPLDQATFQSIFSPLGVTAAATSAAPGVATARSVSGGVVTGACSALDASNVTLTLDDDGIATVATNDPAVVPPARAQAIQRALRAFVHMVGNTINHESAHALGVVSRVRANNQITISGTTVTSPLDGDGGAHNKVTNNTNIVDAGGTRSFVRRIEDTGIKQVFNAANAGYMRDCVPFDQVDN